LVEWRIEFEGKGGNHSNVFRKGLKRI